ncbi:hypothetical protein Malapachy_1615 [Malassezia pachydermatis]|uniref:Uncharacterized protein n=1 Tax=Malassezia pachydermatis TaxID=77020 RepID=A0A0M9VN97_9BASI|nr:hypothetical protein Malapachy_1615 [Malassezia pachydermatis]KOS13112.1 hypothetical protein Malapachy_1615 [Malassezia pachydermatis]
MPTSIVQGSSGAKEPTFSDSKELESFKYQFVNTDTLLLSRTQPSSSSTGNGRSKASPATAKGTTLTFPDPMAVTSTPGAQSTMSMTLSPQELQLPKSIVPNGTEPTPNETMVLISILFKNDMDWSWVVAQRATTAQIFTYMPKIIAYAIRGREDDVQTVQLRQFQNESSVNASYRVMYLAYLDKNMGLALKHAIQDPSSSFYHAPFGPVSQQLAAEVDSSFSLFSYSSVPLSEAKDLSPVTKKALIGCFAGVGGLLVLGLVVWLVLKNKKRSRCALKRTDTINSFGNTIDPVSTLSIATSSSTLQEGSSDGGMPSRVTSRSETLDDPFRGPLSSRTVETDPFSTPYPVRHTSISAGRRWLHSNHTANSYEGDQPTSRDQLIPHVQTIAHASNMGSM